MKENSEWKSFTNLSEFYMDGGTNFEISENPKMLYFSTIAVTNFMTAITMLLLLLSYDFRGS